MPVIERDVVLQSVDENGRQTMDFPITRLGNVEDTADVKEAPAAEDYLPVMDSADGGQMKKAPLSAVLEPAEAALDAAELAQEMAGERATMAQVNAAIEAAISGAIEEVYYGTQNAETAV